MDPTTSAAPTVIVTAFEVAGLPLTQSSLEVSMQVIISLLTGTYEKVELFVPAFVPFTIH